jgi:hypothetical protein
MEEGEVRSPRSGTPQGGVLSPLLSNLYLHELDKRMSRSDGKLIRFADDLVLLCYRRGQARWARDKMRTILNGLGLTVNEEKTRIGHVREGFDFLGFTYREAYSTRQGRLVQVKYPRAKSVRGIQQRIKAAIQSVGLGAEFSEVITVVNRKLHGWANYFRIGNSYAAALGLNEYVCEQLRIWWRRRKQNKQIRGGREWANAYFYRQGLAYLPALMRGGANAA